MPVASASSPISADTAVVDEALRSRVVASYDGEEVASRGELDDLVAFVAELCDVPLALITVVSGDRQLFLSRRGTDRRESPRSISFCTHAIEQAELTEIRDAAADPRFAANPLITGDEHLRFYAGMPMVTAEGMAIGTVCVLDRRPRPDGLTAVQRHGLAVVARAAMARLDDRRLAREQDAAQEANIRALRESELRFRTLADTMPQMVWSTRPDGFHDYYNARWYEFTGVPAGSTDGDEWNGMFHPDDRERAWAAWRHSLTTGDPYQIEYRLRHFDGTYRWVWGRALPIHGADEAIVRWFGTCTDIHQQKMAMEEREVISQELSHRIKNIFAVIAGLITFAARTNPGFAGVASDLRDRITALGRAHDFVRPHSSHSRPEQQQDSLVGLVCSLFEAYRQPGNDRLTITGDDVRIDDRSATPLALLFHELATNATKYGALSTQTGRVRLDVGVNADTVTLVWAEQGGPAVKATGRTGFGSQLVELAAVRQLGGTVSRDWRPEGLVTTITAPVGVFSRT